MQGRRWGMPRLCPCPQHRSTMRNTAVGGRVGDTIRTDLGLRGTGGERRRRAREERTPAWRHRSHGTAHGQRAGQWRERVEWARNLPQRVSRRRKPVRARVTSDGRMAARDGRARPVRHKTTSASVRLRPFRAIAAASNRVLGGDPWHGGWLKRVRLPPGQARGWIVLQRNKLRYDRAIAMDAAVPSCTARGP